MIEDRLSAIPAHDFRLGLAGKVQYGIVVGTVYPVWSSGGTSHQRGVLTSFIHHAYANKKRYSQIDQVAQVVTLTDLFRVQPRQLIPIVYCSQTYPPTYSVSTLQYCYFDAML